MPNGRVKVPSLGGRVAVVASLLATMLVGPSSVARAAAMVQVDPTAGPGGTPITVTGSGFPATQCFVTISFTDANGAETQLGTAHLDSGGGFRHNALIPSNAASGAGSIRAQWWTYSTLYHRCIPSLLGAVTTFTVTLGIQVLGNPGFENGSANPSPWVTTARINDSSAEPPHSGTWDAWLGGTGTTHIDPLYQDVAIPSGITSANLTFWLHVDTADMGASAHDLMRVQARNTSNIVLATLGSYSNLNAAPGYTQQSFDVTTYTGQTIRVFVVSKEDASLQTSFVVDDFALTANSP